jgi:hypothetical protein
MWVVFPVIDAKRNVEAAKSAVDDESANEPGSSR